MPLSRGARLGPYEVIEPIGEGGMGAVYRARDPRLNRDVAIKVLRGDVVSDPDRRARFVQEARAVSSLSHPNIATIYGLEEIGDGRQAIIMELVEGPVSFVDTRNNRREGKAYLKPVQTVTAGVPFGRPYSSPFSVR